MDEHSKERVIANWIKSMLRTWERRLQARPEDERNSALGKRELAQYRQAPQPTPF